MMRWGIISGHIFRDMFMVMPRPRGQVQTVDVRSHCSLYKVKSGFENFVAGNFCLRGIAFNPMYNNGI
ncbi:hypothetical protein EBB07_16185 [Paenibacillaceae bacterium]|nr:hypothetical protein EBB07_16185 [Paenibacillaceae bacterium]